MFWAETRKITCTPANPSFIIQKWGLRGSKLYRCVFVMDLFFSWFYFYWNRYLESAIRPSVFYRSFWNYAYLFYIVWRCASGFGVIFLLYRYKTHNPLLTKLLCRGTLALNGLLFYLFCTILFCFHLFISFPALCFTLFLTDAVERL